MLYPDMNLQKRTQQNTTRYRTALYLRLSREDGDKTESDSIANQRTLLEAYGADHPELCIVDEFVDDGYSGSNFERPAFQRLFQELEQGTINCILVKDLSRFGRNYIEVGRYLERMKEKIYDARTGMEYVLVGDYYLPALKLPRTRPIGRWGMLHKAYLKLRKPAYYQSLLLSGKLDTVLANVEEQAVERYEVLIEQLSRREDVSEKLKEENQMEWVRRMRNLENRAAEIVKAELIYTFERR